MIIYYIFENAGIISEYFLNDDTKSKTNININLCTHFFKVILLIFADLLILPFALCIKHKSKRENKEIQLLSNNIQSKKNNSNKFCSKVVYLILITILDLISRSVYFIFFFFNRISKRENIEKLPERYQMDYIVILDIIFRHIFSRCYLKTEIYKHHKFSIGLCLFGFAIFIAIDYFSIRFTNKPLSLK